MTEERRRRRTPGTWWVNRRFRHFDRPASLTWPEAEWGLAHLAERLGPWHEDTRFARLRVMGWLKREGDTAAALRMAHEDVAGRTADFGPDHLDTLRARSTVVWCRREDGDLDGAVADARLLVEDMTRAHGPDHEDTHRERWILADLIGENGDPPEAVRRLTALYAESRALGPRRTRWTRVIRTSLVGALERNGDLGEALELLDVEIEAERGTIYGVDENLGDHEMKRLQEWRTRLAGELAAERYRRETERRRGERRDRRP
ncbi:hypothetical protein ACH4F6_12845 [Streptomyces sp. NPDC017936]|uniref:hypothetical protein n=1 Tax=Streptomyces sp. NPDC017936 TaxID=3365016 RepID=UPI0037B92745